MNKEETLKSNIAELQRELAALQKQQEYQATLRKRQEMAKAKQANDIGYYAAKTCREHLEVIKITAAQIDIDKQLDRDILTAFQLINKNSYYAIKALERDATERGE